MRAGGIGPGLNDIGTGSAGLEDFVGDVGLVRIHGDGVRRFQALLREHLDEPLHREHAISGVVVDDGDLASIQLPYAEVRRGLDVLRIGIEIATPGGISQGQ